MTYYTFFDSPLQPLLLTSDGTALMGLFMVAHTHGPEIGADWIRDDKAAPFAKARQQLAAYFAGRLTDFDLPTAPTGTAFQMRVWQELRRIPHGQTISYGELARRIGSSTACRAVGLANGRNPLSIIVPGPEIPSPRVVGTGGSSPAMPGAWRARRRCWHWGARCRGTLTFHIKTRFITPQ